MDHTVSYYKYSKVLVLAWNWGCDDGGVAPNELSKIQAFLFLKLDQ